jgi:hypothetical protein
MTVAAGPSWDVRNQSQIGIVDELLSFASDIRVRESGKYCVTFTS